MMGCRIAVNVKIEKPSKEVLRQAVERVAEKIGAKVSHPYVDFYGEKREGFALKMRGDSVGIGIIIENDKIRIEKNMQFSSEEDVRRIKSSIETQYVSIAVQKALRDLGYVVQVEETDREIKIIAEKSS